MAKDHELSSVFMDHAIAQVAGRPDRASTRVLDFGCGKGEVVADLARLGYDIAGCDVDAFWGSTDPALAKRCDVIAFEPYRLPYDDASFDVVLSTSVLEHVLNKREALEEICRVTRPGGCSIHIFPSRWYLPIEPHLRVPLVNWIHPWRPWPWFALWALLGVRNQDQQGMDWRRTVDSNRAFLRRGVSYWTNARYARECREVFGEFETPMRFYVEHGYGGATRLLRKLPLGAFGGWLAKHFRMNLIAMRKRTA